MYSIGKLAVVALATFNLLTVEARPAHSSASASSLTPSAASSSAAKSNGSDPRALAIKNAFLHAWNGYEQYAFGHDELLPVSNQSSDSRNGWGATIFDALDTMLIMGLDTQYQKALGHVNDVNFKKSDSDSKTFETTIRYLGGLLSANDIKPNPILVKQAIAVAEDAIMPAFKNDGIPAAYVDVNTGEPVPGNDLDLAEFGSLQMELTRLSQVTGDSKYKDIANAVVTKVQNTKTYPPGLYPIQWTKDPFEPDTTGTITISGGGDSYYEYLLKNYLLLGSNDESLLSSWQTAVDSMQKYLQQQDDRHPYTFLAEITNGTAYSNSGELICFLPGNVIYGAQLLGNKQYAGFAKNLMDGCVQLWEGTETNIAPESFHWIPKDSPLGNYTASQIAQDKRRSFYFAQNEATYDLRPETVESLFYFYRITGNKTYQNKAWKIFQAIDKYCRTPSGYSSLSNVDLVPPGWSDFQESFLFAETFKYLYLIFSDTSVISLNDWVFNTEAHPFKLPSTLKIQK